MAEEMIKASAKELMPMLTLFVIFKALYTLNDSAKPMARIITNTNTEKASLFFMINYFIDY
jgi:hypothetical protein